MRKISIIIILILSVFQLKSQTSGDYRSISDGNWDNKSIWQIYNGWEWTNVSQTPESYSVNVYVYSNIVLTSNIEIISNLIIESGSLNIGENGLNIKNDFVLNGGELIGGETSTLEINVLSHEIHLPKLTLKNLTINDPYGVVAHNDLIIYQNLKLVRGVLNIGNNNLILYSDAIIGGDYSNTSMISMSANGNIRKYMQKPESILFPIGSCLPHNIYSPVEVIFNKGNFKISSYIDIGVSNIKQLNISYSTSSYLNRFWKIKSSEIDEYSCDLNFQYSDEDVVGSESEIFCMEINNGLFKKGTLAENSKNLMYISTNTLSEYTGAIDNWALGCELVKFEGIFIDKKVKLDWQTLSENRVNLFQVERSIDGVNFQNIGSVAASGNSNELNNYEFYDNDIQLSSKIFYYRLVTIDDDGMSSNSNIINVKLNFTQNNTIRTTFDNANNQILVYYNSAIDNQCKVNLIGISGSIVLSQTFELNEGSNTLAIAPNELATGIYIVSLNDNFGTKSTKLIFSNEFQKSRGKNPNIKVINPENNGDSIQNTKINTDLVNTSEGCRIGVTNNSEFIVDIYIDGVFIGTMNAWAESYFLVNKDFKLFYALTKGKTKEWFIDNNKNDTNSVVLVVPKSKK